MSNSEIKEIQSFKIKDGENGIITSIAVRPDLQQVITCNTNILSFINLNTQQIEHIIKSNGINIHYLYVLYTNDNKYAIVLVKDYNNDKISSEIWDISKLNDKPRIVNFSNSEDYGEDNFKISKDDSTIVLCSSNNITCYDFKSGEIIHTYIPNRNVRITSFFILSSDGKELIIGEYNAIKKIKFTDNNNYNEFKIKCDKFNYLIYNEKDNYFYRLKQNYDNSLLLSRMDPETLTVQFQTSIIGVSNIIGFIDNFIIFNKSIGEKDEDDEYDEDHNNSSIMIYNLDSNFNLIDTDDLADITVNNMYIHWFNQKIINNNLFVLFYKIENNENDENFVNNNYLYQFKISGIEVKNARKKK